jgi:hypothetical protein
MREPDPGGILHLGAAYRGAKVLLSAVELGVFTVLAEGPLEAEVLRRRIGIHARGARDFFDALVAIGMLARDDGLYLNTAETDLYLDARKPSYIGGFLELANNRLYGQWDALSTALRSGRPQNGATREDDTFAAIYRDPPALAEFLRGMTGLTLLPAAALAQRFPWSSYNSFLDIGTAEGCLPVRIAEAHPHLAGGGFDLPSVRAPFERYVRRHGLDDRLAFRAGDFLREPLPAADVLVMGQILHDWDLDTKRMLLAKAHDALPPNGALIVYDLMIDELRRENVPGLLASLSMLIQTPGGFDYTGSDCIDWFHDAGFNAVSIASLYGAYSMVIGIKDGP